eukprot:gene9223-1309_t
MFEDENEKKKVIKIINSPSNSKSFSKYFACSISKNEFCYFQDLEWKNNFLKSMHSNLLKFPNLIHTISNPNIFWEIKKYSFFIRKYKFHTAFSWMNYGTFASKEKIVNFLRQIALLNLQSSNMNLDPYFIIFSNEFPLNLINEIFPFQLTSKEQQEEYKRESKTENFQKGLTKSLKILYSNLINSNQNTFQNGDLIPGLHLRDSKSVCKKDNCILFTNVDSFPSPLSVKYNPDESLSKHLSKFETYPDKFIFLKNYYYFAVDGKTETCWKSSRKILKGSYFGLDLLKHQKIKGITLYFGMNGLIKEFKNSIRIEKSKNQINWKIESGIEFIENFEEKKIEINFLNKKDNLEDDNEEEEDYFEFRFFKFLFLKNLPVEMEICEIKVK